MTRAPWRAVPAREWPLVAAAAAVAVGVEAGLRLASLPRLAGLLGAPLAVDPPEPAVHEHLRLSPSDRRRVRAARRVLRHWPFGDTCLREALVMGHLVRHLHPTLRIGVARIDGALRAHAWLDIDGALLDPLRSAASYSSLHSVASEGSPR